MPIYHDNFIYYLKDPQMYNNPVFDLFRIKNNFVFLLNVSKTMIHF